jgi:hypothetical protein
VIRYQTVLLVLRLSSFSSRQVQHNVFIASVEDTLKLGLVVSVHSLTWMKDFVKHVALGMNG